MEIPADTLESAKMNLAEARLELAIAPLSKGRLSMGKAAELEAVPAGQFQLHLGVKEIGPHFHISMHWKIWGYWRNRALDRCFRRLTVDCPCTGESVGIVALPVRRLIILNAVWTEIILSGDGKADFLRMGWRETRSVND